MLYVFKKVKYSLRETLAAVVHLNCRAGSTFPVVALCTGLAGTTSLTRSDFMLSIG